MNKDGLFNEEQIIERIFSNNCNRVKTYLNRSKDIVISVKNFNENRWPVRYPFNDLSQTENSDLNREIKENVQQVIKANVIKKSGLKRSGSTVSELTDFSSKLPENQNSFSELRILKLDYSKESTSNLISSLDHSAISKLLDDSFSKSIRHIEKLINRVSDTSSKILVTGDLNAGKSTLINALLKRDVLPIDQQPCTMLFIEVVDASKNNGKEEIHAIPNIDRYNLKDESSYDLLDPSLLEDTVQENSNSYQQIKIYSRDNRGKSSSILNNGVVDVSLIDSPGLNRDSLKTTQLFSRQEEIDVVIFVVNAENHFTLSGQDFLASAGNEKDHIFIVVNRFDAISRKDKCRKLILEQINTLSPRTYEESDNLVHFISAKDFVHKDAEPGSDFSRMEECLRWWTLEQRFKSKLAPAQTYILNLLSELKIIAVENTNIALNVTYNINIALKNGKPFYDKLLTAKNSNCKLSEQIIDDACMKIKNYTSQHLDTIVSNLESYECKVKWNGIFSSWEYAESIFVSMAEHLEYEVRECEKFASSIVSSSINSLCDLDSQRASIENKEDKISTKPLYSSNETRSQIHEALAHVGGISNSLDTFGLGMSDFFDLDWDRFMITGSLGISAGSIAVFASSSSGISYALNILKVSSNLPTKTIRNALIVSAGLLSVCSIFLMLNEADATIRRNLSKRIQKALNQDNFTDSHSSRLTSESNRLIRPFVWQFQTNFLKMVEFEERRRADHLRSRHLSLEAQMFFDDLKAEIMDLSSDVHSISSTDFAR
ncbi:Transmembrane GTPase fzo1 [Smittium mucronatum]|uniref:Transmembrane GTPase fzo1 n=1 Tax=Smittium mucronatum TaxID=133383 RepID=A0A1R0GYG8_9FUNG|nr:Transmembrane GTPase fzo1 [Smittium mucronatum]